MGCCGSGNKDDPSVEAARRRLSVGAVDKPEGGDQAAGGSNVDEDRGMIKSLDGQKLTELIASGLPGGRKFSIGSETDKGLTSFANKGTSAQGDTDGATQANHIGYTCRKGLKPESPNQDSWIVFCTDFFSIYGVFDGHGQKGHDVSQFVKEHLPKLLLQDKRFQAYMQEVDELERGAKMIVVQDVCKDAFKKVQSLIATAVLTKQLDAQLAGTTCTIAIHDHKVNKVVVAHVADSTAVLGKKDGKAVQLTRDHKPDLKDERARIEKAGGRVVFDGYSNHRVYAKNGRYPGLNMSRCLGDLLGHQDCGCSAEPETKILDLTAEDGVLLLCSDGVWEFLDPPTAVAIVNEAGKGCQASKAADKLAKDSWDRWIQEEGGAVVDDITVLCIFLNGGP